MIPNPPQEAYTPKPLKHPRRPNRETPAPSGSPHVTAHPAATRSPARAASGGSPRSRRRAPLVRCCRPLVPASSVVRRYSWGPPTRCRDSYFGNGFFFPQFPSPFTSRCHPGSFGPEPGTPRRGSLTATPESLSIKGPLTFSLKLLYRLLHFFLSLFWT